MVILMVVGHVRRLQQASLDVEEYFTQTSVAEE
jgi:hypothetical protein